MSFDVGIEFARFVSFGDELLSVLAARSWHFAFLALLLLAETDAKVLTVPQAERRSIDRDNGTLDERVRAHQLVVRRIVDDFQNTRLSSNRYEKI